jgi:hypothetical protein
MNATVVYLYALDMAHEADLAAIEKKMQGAMQRFHLSRSKDAPRGFPFYRPLVLQMDDVAIEGPLGPATLSISIKLFSVGAMSVDVRMPVACDRLADLVVFRNLRFKDGTTLDDYVREVGRTLLETVRPHLDTPLLTLESPEVYTIFCLPPLTRDVGASDAGPCPSMEDWLSHHRREVAGLLAGEKDASCLSEQEVQETLKHNYSYYGHDLAVLDWDAALVVDRPDACQETLYVLETANLQLEELKVYDAELDKVLDKAYEDVQATAGLRGFRQRQRVLADLREIRMDLMEMSDELANITKFIGDWHLARVFMGCAARFHLPQWGEMVSQKLRSLDGLYSMLQQDSTNRWMLSLEIAVVALFVIDVVVIVILGIK